MSRRDDRFAARRMHAAFGAAHEWVGKLRGAAGSTGAARSARGTRVASRLRAGLCAGSLSALELLEKPLAREEHKNQQEKLAHDLTNSRGE